MTSTNATSSFLFSLLLSPFTPSSPSVQTVYQTVNIAQLYFTGYLDLLHQPPGFGHTSIRILQTHSPISSAVKARAQRGNLNKGSHTRVFSFCKIHHILRERHFPWRPSLLKSPYYSLDRLRCRWRASHTRGIFRYLAQERALPSLITFLGKGGPASASVDLRISAVHTR